MTHDEALAEVHRRQDLHPGAKWVAVRRGSEWTVASIGLAPSVIRQTGTATKPPPIAPRDEPYSMLERVTRLYGSG